MKSSKKKQGGLLYSDRRFSSAKELIFINVYILNQCQSPQIRTASINKYEGRDRFQYSNSWGLQCPTFRSRSVIQTENQQRKMTELSCTKDQLYLTDIGRTFHSTDARICSFQQHMKHCPGQSAARSQNKSQQIFLRSFDECCDHHVSWKSVIKMESYRDMEIKQLVSKQPINQKDIPIFPEMNENGNTTY